MVDVLDGFVAVVVSMLLQGMLRTVCVVSISFLTSKVNVLDGFTVVLIPEVDVLQGLLSVAMALVVTVLATILVTSEQLTVDGLTGFDAELASR